MVSMDSLDLPTGIDHPIESTLSRARGHRGLLVGCDMGSIWYCIGLNWARFFNEPLLDDDAVTCASDDLGLLYDGEEDDW
jgi:hypothetical protein